MLGGFNPGDKVIVVRGRKVPKGTKGEYISSIAQLNYRSKQLQDMGQKWVANYDANWEHIAIVKTKFGNIYVNYNYIALDKQEVK